MVCKKTLDQVWKRILRQSRYSKCGALRDLVPFVQFKKREKNPWRSVTFSKVAGLKVTLLHGCFSCFLNCTHGTKSCNAPQIRNYFLTAPQTMMAPLNATQVHNRCMYQYAPKKLSTTL